MELATEPGSAAGTQANGATPSDWRASLSDAYEVKDDKGQVTAKLNLRTDPTLAKYKSADDLARAYLEANKQLSTGAPPKAPGPNANPEERAAFYDALGRPKDATGYAAVKPPEGVQPEGLAAFVQNVAVPGRWAPEDVQAAVNFLGEYQSRQMRDTIAQWDEGQEALRKEWGYNFDRNHDMSARFLQESFKKAGVSAEFSGMLDKIGLGHNPEFIKWTHMLATNATEDVFVPGAPDADASAAAMDAKIAEARKAFSEAMPGTPVYTAARERYESMMKARWGTQEATG